VQRLRSRPALTQQLLSGAFGGVLLLRLLFPYFDSPTAHLFSDPLRHWNNGLHFLHPDLMGGGDPFLYQLWMALLQALTGGNKALLNLGCGLLCALMCYGWYRALRELVPKSWALGGALLIGLWPATLGIYAYFMNETLLLTLTGLAFWATLRARRKASSGAFAWACVLWAGAAFTRPLAAPLALLSLSSLWLTSPQKPRRALIGVLALAALAVPAAWHSRAVLGFMAPLGNFYLNEIYAASGNSVITVDAGAAGSYWFSSPSFHYRPFYPFSNWMSARSGNFAFHVDPRRGRADWQHERLRALAQRSFGRARQRGEDLVFLLFGQSWPDCDLNALSGAWSVWGRWLWLPLLCAAVWGVARRRPHGWEWLLPACGLGAFLLLALQSEGVMEGRFRKPVEPILLAALVVMLYRGQSSTRGATAAASGHAALRLGVD
jgi:hypothetical protein